MNDIELNALTLLVQTEQIQREWANEKRRNNGFALAYDEETEWPNQERLDKELKRRGVLP